MRLIYPLLYLLFFTILACDEASPSLPKQRMYPQINFPLAKDTITSRICNFSFTHPDYLSYRRDSFFFGEKPINDCWFDLHNEILKTSVYCSYFTIKDKKHFEKLVEDCFKASSAHNVKANARRESLIDKANGVGGLLFEIDGPVASPIQFFITDSTKNFFRGSLYFNAKVNPDSTAPVLKFFKSDIQNLINSFEWAK